MKQIVSAALVLWVMCAARQVNAVSYADAPRVMVVESQFDSVTSVLEQYRVHYTILSAADLQQGEWIESCDLLFIPCGYGPGIEQQMQILVAGTDLRGVALSPDYRHIDEKKNP